MARQNRKMPANNVIKRYWANYLIRIGKFDSLEELMNGDICFACGWEKRLQRCHITARMISMDDSESNLHLLCSHCHNESEMLGNNIDDRSDYWEWFCGMNQLKRIMNSTKASYLTELMLKEKIDHNDIVEFSRSIETSSKNQLLINPDLWDYSKPRLTLQSLIENHDKKINNQIKKTIKISQSIQLSLFA